MDGFEFFKIDETQLKDGDILIVKVDESERSWKIVELVSEYLRNNLPNNKVLFVPNGMDFEILRKQISQ